MITSTSRTLLSFSKQTRALSSQRCRSTSATQAPKDDESYPKGFYPVYVHHVSKIALEHLQMSQAEWVMEKGLDTGLHINPNGTFSMSFPARKGFDSGRIWTSYDSAGKQHWLSVYRQKLAVRFLLKDHGKSVATPSVHDSSRNEREIQQAVDQMVYAINDAEATRLS